MFESHPLCLIRCSNSLVFVSFRIQAIGFKFYSPNPSNQTSSWLVTRPRQSTTSLGKAEGVEEAKQERKADDRLQAGWLLGRLREETNGKDAQILRKKRKDPEQEARAPRMGLEL